MSAADLLNLEIKQQEKLPLIQPTSIPQKRTEHRLPIKNCIEFAVVLFFLLPSIAAIIVAIGYDRETSPCNDNTIAYTVALDTYLYIGGGYQIGITLLGLVCNFLSDQVFRLQIGGGVILFIWIIIGLNIYTYQMSGLCKSTPIAMMMLAWCIIPLCVMGMVGFALLFPLYRNIKKWVKSKL